MPPLPKKVLARVAAGIATTTVAVVVLLWWVGTRDLEGEKLVTARFDAQGGARFTRATLPSLSLPRHGAAA